MKIAEYSKSSRRTGSIDGPSILMEGVRGQHEHHNKEKRLGRKLMLFAIFLLQLLKPYAAACDFILSPYLIFRNFEAAACLQRTLGDNSSLNIKVRLFLLLLRLLSLAESFKNNRYCHRCETVSQIKIFPFKSTYNGERHVLKFEKNA